MTITYRAIRVDGKWIAQCKRWLFWRSVDYYGDAVLSGITESLRYRALDTCAEAIDRLRLHHRNRTHGPYTIAQIVEWSPDSDD